LDLARRTTGEIKKVGLYLILKQ